MVTRKELQKKYKLKILLRGPTGTGKCAKKGTLVLTEKGLIKIEDLIRGVSDSENNNKDSKQYSSLGCDDDECIDNAKSVKNVISISGQLKYGNHEISGRYDNGINDLICINTTTGLEISGTPEHKVVIINNNGDLVFKKLSDVTNDDYVALTYGTNIFNDKLKLNFAYRKK